MGLGEIAALSAAVLWTISSFLWGRIDLNAFQLNSCKNLVGVFLLAGHVGVLMLLAANADNSATESSESFQLVASLPAWGWLALSGLIGIIIGDTLYFRSLQILGPRKALMMATTSPLFAIAAGWFWLSESLLAINLLGILLTVSGIVVVVAERSSQSESQGLFPGTNSNGLIWSLLAAGCQAIGAAVSKVGMNIDDCGALEATWIRIFFAGVCSLLIIAMRGQFVSFFKKVLTRKILTQVTLAAVIGTWLGIWMSQIAVKETKIGIAQTLFATSPLFAIPIVRFIQGRKISALAILGTMVALVGIALTVWE